MLYLLQKGGDAMLRLQISNLSHLGYNNGWENYSEHSDKLELYSALHPTRIFVRMNTQNTFRIDIPHGRLHHEMHRAYPKHFNGVAFYINDEDAFCGFLRRAAGIDSSLPDQPLRIATKRLHEELATLGTYTTETERLLKTRIGQQVFRESLLAYWGERCAVTGLDIPEALRASHIKPWAQCSSDAERLDVFNGFLLSANLDALFDRNLITFDATGKIQYLVPFSSAQKAHLGLHDNSALRWIEPEHIAYLRHREMPTM